MKNLVKKIEIKDEVADEENMKAKNAEFIDDLLKPFRDAEGKFIAKWVAFHVDASAWEIYQLIPTYSWWAFLSNFRRVKRKLILQVHSNFTAIPWYPSTVGVLGGLPVTQKFSVGIIDKTYLPQAQKIANLLINKYQQKKVTIEILKGFKNTKFIGYIS